MKVFIVEKYDFDVYDEYLPCKVFSSVEAVEDFMNVQAELGGLEEDKFRLNIVKSDVFTHYDIFKKDGFTDMYRVYEMEVE